MVLPVECAEPGRHHGVQIGPRAGRDAGGDCRDRQPVVGEEDQRGFEHLRLVVGAATASARAFCPTSPAPRRPPRQSIHQYADQLGARRAPPTRGARSNRIGSPAPSTATATRSWSVMRAESGRRTLIAERASWTELGRRREHGLAWSAQPVQSRWATDSTVWSVARSPDRVAAVVQLVVLQQRQLGLDPLDDAGVLDGPAGQPLDVGGREQAAAPAARPDAGQLTHDSRTRRSSPASPSARRATSAVVR